MGTEVAVDRCAGCGLPAPVNPHTEGSSLLTTKYGWRLRRVVDASGDVAVEARCPTCHARQRGASMIGGLSLRPDSAATVPSVAPVVSSAVSMAPAGQARLASAPGVRLGIDDGGELVFGFPGDVSAAQVSLPTHIRATVVAISQASLRRAGLFDKYIGLVPADVREQVRTVVAGEWCDFDLVIAHYRACDALRLRESELLRAGRDVGLSLQKAVLGVARTGTGVTPLFMVEQVRASLPRFMNGAGVAVYKLGATELRLEFAGFPFAEFEYCRVALRGVIETMLQRCAPAVRAHDVVRLRTPRFVAYRVTWG